MPPFSARMLGAFASPSRPSRVSSSASASTTGVLSSMPRRPTRETKVFLPSSIFQFSSKILSPYPVEISTTSISSASSYTFQKALRFRSSLPMSKMASQPFPGSLGRFLPEALPPMNITSMSPGSASFGILTLTELLSLAVT